jgi:signal transduction histidine kinase
LTSDLHQIKQVRYATIALCLIAPPSAWLYVRMGMSGTAAVLALGALAGLVNLFAIGRRVSPHAGGHIALSILYLVLLTTSIQTGGYYTPAFGWFYVVPMVAAAVLDLRGAWVWVGITLATAASFWWLPQLGVEFPNFVPAEYAAGHALFNRVSAIFALASVLTSFKLLQKRAKQEIESANLVLHRESKYVQLLQHAAVAANESGSLQEAMQRSVARICTAMGWPAGQVLCVGDDGRLHTTEIWQGQGWQDDLRPLACDTLSPGERLPGRVLVSRRPGAVTDFGKAGTERAAQARQLGLRASIALPVMANGEVVAVLEFGSGEPLELDARFEEVLASIGIQLGRVFERAGLQDRLRQSQKMEAVGRLAAGLAHEINNPMAYVRSNLAQLDAEWESAAAQIDKLEDTPRALVDSLHEGHELIRESAEGVELTIAIVRDVKDFSHIASSDLAEVDLCEVVASAIRVANPRGSQPLTIETQLPELPRLRCSSNQLQQVFVNLVANAIQAVDDSGHVAVTAHREEDGLCVRVTDDGPGILPAHRERLFEPFFTTKPVGEGTGLGLYVSYEIVASHGGRIEVHSEPGAGTCFEVHLPLSQGDGGAATAGRPSS